MTRLSVGPAQVGGVPAPFGLVAETPLEVPMHQQLVLQWLAGSEADYDDLVAMEDRLLAGLDSTGAEVDGPDLGSGQMNILTSADRPHQTFATASNDLAEDARSGKVRAAFRPADGDEYSIFWPESLQEFVVS